MSDRHIRRSGDDYAEAMLNLLPQGAAWPRERTRLLSRVITALAQIWGKVDGRAADLLERESDPRMTIELLEDWERNWGLPDPCFAEPLTIAERQAVLVRKMTMIGAQSRAFFIDVAAQIGHEIRIREWSPFMAGVSRVGDTRGEWGEVWGRASGAYPVSGDQITGGLPVSGGGFPSLVSGGVSGDVMGTEGYLFRWEIGPPEIRYYWSIHVGLAHLMWFRAASGQSGVDPHLRIGLETELECLLRRWKPAHTEIVMDYSYIRYGGPMQGTP